MFSVRRGDILSTSEEYLEYIGGCSVHRRDLMIHVGRYHEYIGPGRYHEYMVVFSRFFFLGGIDIMSVSGDV